MGGSIPFWNQRKTPMPTYEYHCDACEHNFDEFQSIKDAPLKKCPECGKLKLRRVFGTGAGVIFKGSGFYQTDYRSESYRKAVKAEQESASKSSEKPTGSGDAPAANAGSNGDGGKGGKGTKARAKTSKSDT